MQEMLQLRKVIQTNTQKRNSANIQNMNQYTSHYYKKNSVFEFSGKRNHE